MFWKSRSKPAGSREYWIAALSMTTGASLGAGVMYFCDPNRGHARRREVAGKTASLIAQGERLIERQGRSIRSRTGGILAEARSLFHRNHRVSDDVVLERVRSRLSHVVEHPQSVSAKVEDGIVTLTGTVARVERKGLLKEIREVPGVSKLEDLLVNEARRNGRSVPRIVGGLAGAGALVLLALAGGRSHSASRRAAA
jgi:hypothetical protein